MRNIQLEAGDIAVILKKRPGSMVPGVQVHAESGQLGLITRLSLLVTTGTVIPKIEIDVCGDLSEEAVAAMSEDLKKSADATANAFLGFTGVKIKRPGTII